MDFLVINLLSTIKGTNKQHSQAYHHTIIELPMIDTTVNNYTR